MNNDAAVEQPLKEYCVLAAKHPMFWALISCMCLFVILVELLDSAL